MAKTKTKYFEPTEQLKGLSDFGVYREQIKKSSPALRQELLKQRKAEVAKMKAQEAYFRDKNATQQLAFAQAAANQRNRKMGIMASRAERLELEAVSLDEVPLLHTMERERTRLSTPPDRFIVQTERMATDSFPD